MSRLTFRKRHDSGLPYKRDTPLKAAARSRGCRKPVRLYGALPEEAEVERLHQSFNPALLAILKLFIHCFWISFFLLLQSNIKPGHCESSTLHGRSSALIGDSEDIAVLSLEPNSRKTGPSISPTACTKIPVTSGSTTSLNLESDVISSSDKDEDEYSGSSTVSNSLPSPEIFRKDTDGVAFLHIFHHSENCYHY